MMIPVLTTNPGIKKYQHILTVFLSLIQEEEEFQYMDEDYIETSTVEKIMKY